MKIITFPSDDAAILRDKLRLLWEAAESVCGPPPANKAAGGLPLRGRKKGLAKDASKWD